MTAREQIIFAGIIVIMIGLALSALPSQAESHAEMDQMIARIIVLEQKANALAETCPKISPQGRNPDAI